MGQDAGTVERPPPPPPAAPFIEVQELSDVEAVMWIADPESRIATVLQITAMPTLVLCRKGEVVRRAVDAAGRAALLRDLDTLLD